MIEELSKAVSDLIHAEQHYIPKLFNFGELRSMMAEWIASSGHNRRVKLDAVYRESFNAREPDLTAFTNYIYDVESRTPFEKNELSVCMAASNLVLERKKSISDHGHESFLKGLVIKSPFSWLLIARIKDENINIRRVLTMRRIKGLIPFPDENQYIITFEEFVKVSNEVLDKCYDELQEFLAKQFASGQSEEAIGNRLIIAWEDSGSPDLAIKERRFTLGNIGDESGELMECDLNKAAKSRHSEVDFVRCANMADVMFHIDTQMEERLQQGFLDFINKKYIRK
jgi:hypothetical protein